MVSVIGNDSDKMADGRGEKSLYKDFLGRLRVKAWGLRPKVNGACAPPTRGEVSDAQWS